MEKKKSYQELLKEYTMTQKQNGTLAMEWYIDLFLNGLLQKRREEHLRAEIDRALDDRDKKTFMELSEELTSIVGL
jgi:uncharacterized protein YpiB (UPF0302 family)